MTTSRCYLVFAVAAALALVSTGCDERESKLALPQAETTPGIDQSGIDKDLAALGRGKDPQNSIEIAAYDEAVRRLIARGSAIEGPVIDALRRSSDWAVRLGCIEVLQGIGTRLCVDHLMEVLIDPEPIVSLRATTTLEELTKHREIPLDGEPVGANGLDPVPKRDPKDKAMDAELRIWAGWTKLHGSAHQKAWKDWWADHGKDTPVL